MTQPPADPAPPPPVQEDPRRGPGFGLGATLALSPLVWAQNPPGGEPGPAPASKAPAGAAAELRAAGQTGIAGGGEHLGDREIRRRCSCPAQVPEGFRGSPFDDFLRRFFEEHGGSDQAQASCCRTRSAAIPNNDEGKQRAKRIALGSGFIIDPSGTVVTNNHVVGEAAKVAK